MTPTHYLRPLLAPRSVALVGASERPGSLGRIVFENLIAGAFVGGAVISRFGIWHALLWLGVLQVVSNVGYAIAASSAVSHPMFYSVVIIENFCGGLGTAAFLAFLMSVCDREHAATQYAMLSAAFALTRFVIGSFSGILAQDFGYAKYFWLTVILGIPGLLLVPLIRNADLMATTVNATEV